MGVRIEDLAQEDFSDVAEPGAPGMAPVHPGEVLRHEFLEPLGITQYRLAKEIGVPQRRIGEIVAGKRAVTADTGLRLSRFFGLNDGFWTGLQADYDTAVARAALGEVLAAIKPWRGGATAA